MRRAPDCPMTTPTSATASTTATSTAAAKRHASEALALEAALDVMLSGASSPSSASDGEPDSSSTSSGDETPRELGLLGEGLDLELLMGHMDDPVLSRLLSAEDETAAATGSAALTAWPAASTSSELYPLSAAPTPKVAPPSSVFASTMQAAAMSTTGNVSVAAGTSGSWDDCLWNLSESLTNADVDMLGVTVDGSCAPAFGNDWLDGPALAFDFGMAHDVDIVAL